MYLRVSVRSNNLNYHTTCETFFSTYFPHIIKYFFIKFLILEKLHLGRKTKKRDCRFLPVVFALLLALQKRFFIQSQLFSFIFLCSRQCTDCRNIFFCNDAGLESIPSSYTTAFASIFPRFNVMPATPCVERVVFRLNGRSVYQQHSAFCGSKQNFTFLFTIKHSKQWGLITVSAYKLLRLVLVVYVFISTFAILPFSKMNIMKPSYALVAAI